MKGLVMSTKNFGQIRIILNTCLFTFYYNCMCFHFCFSFFRCVLIIKQYILVLGEGPTQGLDDGKITVEAKYPINFNR